MFRLHSGPPPSNLSDLEFMQNSNDWRPLREPSIQTYTILSTVVAAVVVGCAIAVVKAVTGNYPSLTPTSWWDVLGVAAMLVIHEFLHLLAHPQLGGSRLSILGIWPKAGVAYAQYLGEMTVRRFLLILVAPVFVLSFVPIVVSLFGVIKVDEWPIRYALWNLLFSAGDLFGIGLLLRDSQISQTVKNLCWQTWVRGK